jgi:hypothetical protein
MEKDYDEDRAYTLLICAIFRQAVVADVEYICQKLPSIGRSYKNEIKAEVRDYIAKEAFNYPNTSREAALKKINKIIRKYLSIIESCHSMSY